MTLLLATAWCRQEAPSLPAQRTPPSPLRRANPSQTISLPPLRARTRPAWPPQVASCLSRTPASGPTAPASRSGRRPDAVAGRGCDLDHDDRYGRGIPEDLAADQMPRTEEPFALSRVFARHASARNSPGSTCGSPSLGPTPIRTWSRSTAWTPTFPTSSAPTLSNGAPTCLSGRGALSRLLSRVDLRAQGPRAGRWHRAPSHRPRGARTSEVEGAVGVGCASRAPTR